MPIEMGEEPDIYKIFCIAPIIRGFFVVVFLQYFINLKGVKP